MNFAQPGQFLIFPLIGGIIVLLYFLKMRRKEMKVPARFLWPESTYEIRANSLFQKLKFSWLLLLQLLACAAIVFALARPQMRQHGKVGKVSVIVVDTSASMGASDVKPSRFGKAVSQAKALIDAAGTGDRIALIDAGPVPRTAASLTNDTVALRNGLDSIELSQAEGDISEALRLASAVAGRIDGARILLISDGVFEDVVNFSPGKAKVEFVQIGTGGENAAIQALGTAKSAYGNEVFVSVRNYGVDPSRGNLNLFADGELFNSLEIEVPAGKTLAKTVDAPEGMEVCEARLTNNDDLTADNYAAALANTGRQVKTLLVSPGDLFLERALSLDPRIVLDKAQELPESAKTGAYDLVVFAGIKESSVQAKAVLSFGTPGPDAPAQFVRTETRPDLTQAASSGPFADIDFSTCFAAELASVKPKSAAKVFTAAGDLPLIIGSEGKVRRLYIALDPLKTDLPLQPTFPILIGDCIDWLVPAGSMSQSYSIESGRTISFDSEGRHSAGLIFKGDGSKQEIQARNGRLILRRLAQVGEYSLGSRKLFVSLKSETESNLRAQKSVVLGSQTAASSGSLWNLADLWRPFLFACLAILAFEWHLFMRKS